MKKSSAVTAIAVAAFVVCSGVIANSFYQEPTSYSTKVPEFELKSKPLYITALAPTADGQMVVASKGEKSVTLYEKGLKSKIHTWQLPGVPTGIAIDGDKAYVTADNSTINIIDLNNKIDIRHADTKMGATFPIITPDAIYVLEQFNHTVAKFNPTTLEFISRAAVKREPKEAALSKDGKYLFVANFLPAQRADLDYVAADVTIINTQTMEPVKDIKLSNGSNALRGMTLSEDGKYVFVSHNLGRFTVPTSQLQQGWMNTSAMSVIDAENQQYIGAVILDEPDRGAAGIWDIKCADGKIIVSHSGTHDISVIDYQKFTDKLKNYSGDVETLAYDLQFMYGMRQRIPLVGNGPREMAVVENQVFIPTYFSDTVNVVDLKEIPALTAIIPLVKDREETLAQKGEKIFNDAQYCFQQWQSCNGCHPGDGRTDGMNWDLMNDGIGNSKNCKSLLYSIQTPPSMISGIRTSAELANRKGFTHIQFYEIPEELAKAIDAYTYSLEALPSPYLVDGKLSQKAQAGKKVYEKLGCAECHSGPYYTDLKMHRIGEDIEFEAGWDTPTLREVWRTAPYLFDGRAETMLEVFEKYKHGIDKKVSKKELEELTEYVLSL